MVTMDHVFVLERRLCQPNIINLDDNFQLALPNVVFGMV